MNKIKIKNRKLILNKKELPLLSGEVHYWRLNPDCWEKIVDRVKELGLNIIASYVPWEYHEYAKDKLDFEGKTAPQRNLLKFIKLLKQKNIWLIIRAGPYLYTEWVNKGVPLYLIKYHRNYPEFLKKSKWYIKNLCKAIKPYLATNKGNIILVQADNEIDVWSRYYEEDMGFLNKKGVFQKFLKVKYKSIDNLNRCCRTNYKNFDEVKPITKNIIDDLSYKRRYIDFCEFRHWYGIENAKWMVSEYRKNRINVPIYLNAYPSVEIQHLAEFQNIADIVGIDIYPVNEFRSQETEHRYYLDMVRYVYTFSTIPYIAELESGIWQGAHYNLGILTPNHYRLVCFSLLQAGAAGWNWYMIVNRDNWYMCPINEWGRKRLELYPVFQKIVSLFNQIKPTDCEKLTETAASYDMLQTASFPDYFVKNLVYNALYDADINYEFFDVSTGKISKKLLFYANEQYLSEQGQKALLKYVESGGNLVIFQNFPRQDEYFNPLNILNIKELDKILEPHECVIELGNEKVKIDSPLFVYNKVPGIPIIAEYTLSSSCSLEEDISFEKLIEGKKNVIGYIEKKGNGRIIVLGVIPSPSLIVAIHRYLGIKIYSRSLIKAVITSILSRDKKYFLIVTNNNLENKFVKIMLHKEILKNTKQAVNLMTDEKLEITESGELTVYVPAKDGTVLLLASCF
ncbi:MAG: beta-galactosidase [Candidatus Hydrogenedentota bacterium]